jgi:hypothetical protein
MSTHLKIVEKIYNASTAAGWTVVALPNNGL